MKPATASTGFARESNTPTSSTRATHFGNPWFYRSKWSRNVIITKLVALTPGAERPIFTLIWSYRIQKRGGKPDLNAARACLDYIEAHSRDGFFYSNTDPARKDFQSWYDLCAFDVDDVISYNQGLMVVGLLAARELGA